MDTTLTGTLLRIHDSGYGFLFTRKGEPDYFILRSDVPVQTWVKGSKFDFNPLPPKPGTSSPRAGNPVPVAG